LPKIRTKGKDVKAMTFFKLLAGEEEVGFDTIREEESR
jgi:hypothetical protein